MFKKLGEDSNRITEMRRELDELKQERKKLSSERLGEFQTFDEPIKDEALEETQQRVEYYEEQHQVDREATDFFES